MCLEYDETATNGFWNTKGRKGKNWCWAYKFYNRHNNRLFPIFTVVHNNMEPVSPGYIKSNRKEKLAFTDLLDEKFKYTYTQAICRGIHVITDSRKLPEYAKVSILDDDFVVVRVKCYKKDFVAASINDIESEDWKTFGGEAVFMKVFLPKSEYDAALKRKKEKKSNTLC